MIGNSLRSDISGAQNIGIKTIWINRDKNANEKKITPDYIITNLEEIYDILKNI